MASAPESDLPIIADLRDFDFQSGTFLEKLVFNHRPVVVALCLLVTLVLGYQATGIKLQAGFEKTLPKSHPYVLNYRANQIELPWQTVTTMAQCLHRLQESRRMRLASLEMWPDNPFWESNGSKFW